MLAERLSWPQVTMASVVEAQGDQVRIKRDGDTATEVIGASMPLVLSVTDQSGEARYPSFKGIMAAKKKTVTTVSVGDLDIDPATVGAAGALTSVTAVAPKPPKSAGEKVVDDGDGGARVAAFLVAQKLV